MTFGGEGGALEGIRPRKQRDHQKALALVDIRDDGALNQSHGNGGGEERTDPSSIQEDTLTGLGAGVEEKGENEGQMSYLGDDTHDSAIIQVIAEKEKEI